MVYTFRVTLSGIKGFFRVYNVNAENTLYSFHKQMRDDMEFPLDQVILFKGLDAQASVVARYGLIDLGAGAVDEVTIGQAIKKGITSFVYFYDVTNKKSVNITFEGESQESCVTPVLVDVKGPNPIDFENGYVAFEDLPDEQRHLPSESDKNRKKGLEALLDAIGSDDDDDEDIPDNDVEDEDDDDEDEDDISGDEDGIEIFDGSEDLTL